MEEFDDFIDVLADHLGLEEEGGGEEEEEEEGEEEERKEEEEISRKNARESPASPPRSPIISSISSPEPKKRKEKGREKEKEGENQILSSFEISEEEEDFGLRKSAKIISSSASVTIPETGSRSADTTKKIAPTTGGGFSLIEFQFNKLSGGKGYLNLPDLTGWVFIQVGRVRKVIMRDFNCLIESIECLMPLL